MKTLSELEIKKIGRPTARPSVAVEGTIYIDKDYVYIYTNGQWIRVPLNEYER